MAKYDLRKEAEETDIQLSAIIAKLGVLGKSEIEKLLPKRTDQKALSRLIKAVNDSAGENNKMAVLSERLGGISAAVRDVVLKLV